MNDVVSVLQTIGQYSNLISLVIGAVKSGKVTENTLVEMIEEILSQASDAEMRRELSGK